MPLNALMPIGIIEDHHNEDTFTFLRLPVKHSMLELDSDVVVWNYLNNKRARCRGKITELTNEIGSVIITNTDIDDGWPNTTDPFGYANPVYLAANPDTVYDDLYQPLQTTDTLVQDNKEMELLQKLAKEHEKVENVPPAFAAMVNRVPANVDFLDEEPL